MQDILTQYLREEAMQEIFTRNLPEKSGSKCISAAVERIEAYLRSSPMVRALRLVGTFSTTVNLSGESSWMTVRLPSPQEANA